MPISNIQLQAQIVNVPVKHDFNFRINVRKDFNFLRYAPTFAGDESGVSFVDFNELNPIQNVTILDKTRDVIENSPLQVLESVEFTGTFTFPKGNFLMTDVFITDSNFVQQPQYFKHDLTNLGFDIVDIEVLDKDFNPVTLDQYAYFDEEATLGFPSKHIYTNLRGSFNILTGESEVFYVRYKNATSFETFVDLLSPKPVYVEVLFGSDPAERQYSVQTNLNTNDVTVHFDSKNLSPTPISTPRVAIKFVSEDRIFVQRPVITDADRKWKLRITNGEFFKNLAGTVTDDNIGVGDNIEDTFGLGITGVVPTSVTVKLDGVPLVGGFVHSAQTGPGLTDEVIFIAPPAVGVVITVSYVFDPQIGRYYIPEFNDQIFSPVRPFKLKTDHTAFVLSSRLLFVEPENIANLGIAGFYIEITQIDTEGNVVTALTNDPDADAYITPRGTTTDVFFIKDAIQSVDESDGFIRLRVDIDPLLETRVTYRYLEKFLEYSDLEVNPALNPFLQDKKALVYMIPELSRVSLAGTTTDTIIQSVFYLVIDKADNIIIANEDPCYASVESVAESGSTTTLIDTTLLDVDCYTGFEVLIIGGPNTGRRLQIEGYNTITKEISIGAGNPWLTGIIEGTPYRINKKVNAYSFTDPVTSTLFNFPGWKETHTNHPDFKLILAEVRPNNTTAVEGLGLTDIRVRGGGVADSNITVALGAQSEATWYWDLGSWDGRAYPGMGALLVELPRSILQERGGPFEPKQVLDIVSRHMADGYYPLIQYYDRSSQILDLTPGSQEVLVEWLNVEASQYKIRYGLNPLNLDFETIVAGTETELLVTGLDNNKVYFFSVVSCLGAEEQFPSRLASAVPFDLAIVAPPATYGIDFYGEATYNT